MRAMVEERFYPRLAMVNRDELDAVEALLAG
jgi:hypothetical protein